MDTAKQLETPSTEGIKYAGSKLRLIPYILRLADKTGARTVFDAFSGTTRVAQALAKTGRTVAANDTAEWSRIFGVCFLKNVREQSHYREIIKHLNALPGKDGWFTENYGGDGSSPVSYGKDGLKKPFQIHNTRRLDAIRDEIERMDLAEEERAVVLVSLMLALDKVDNTLGHFASYLRKWSGRSHSDLKLEVPAVRPSRPNHRVFSADVFDLLDSVEADLSYFDPPYGSNNEKMPPSRIRYGAYYHFWTTVVLNDRPPLFGKAGRRRDSSDETAISVFEEFRRGEDGEYIAVKALERLIREARSEHVILSYSSGGRANLEVVEKILRKNGEIVETVSIGHRKNVMASMSWTGDWTSANTAPNTEFLFLLRK